MITYVLEVRCCAEDPERVAARGYCSCGDSDRTSTVLAETAEANPRKAGVAFGGSFTGVSEFAENPADPRHATRYSFRPGPETVDIVCKNAMAARAVARKKPTEFPTHEEVRERVARLLSGRRGRNRCYLTLVRD